MGPVIESGFQQAGHYVISEDIYLSREQVLLNGEGKVASGTVLGKVSVGTLTAAPKAGNTGNGTISAVTAKSGTKSGTYVVEFTAATKFDVTDPEGFKVKSGTVGTAYSDDLGFTITAGGTAFVAGDAFNIAVDISGKTYEPLGLGGEAGGILWEGRTLVAGTASRCVITARDSQVVGELLTWPEGITAAQKQVFIDQLEALHIILR